MFCSKHLYSSMAVLIAALCAIAPVSRADTAQAIPLHASDLSTYYVTVAVAGAAEESYLLDTGAGYMTITEATLAQAQRQGRARYLRDLQGVMADGRSRQVPVYELSEIRIGTSCTLTNVEAAVIPGAHRGLLGLSVLEKFGSMALRFDPPALTLTNCQASRSEAHPLVSAAH